MNNRGSIVFVFLLVLVLTGLGATFLLGSVNEHIVAQRVANSSTALWMAEAGLQKAMWEYTYNSCTGMVRQGTNTACTTCSNCGGGNKTLAGTLSGSGDYDIVMDSGSTTLQSTGSVPSRTSTSKVLRKIQAGVSRPAIFANGIYAQGQVNLSNNAVVDSYNSSSGAYGGANIHTNGNVGTNGISAGIINISNNATVKGNVSTGVGGTVTLGAGATVTGTTTHTNSVALPAVVVPNSLTSLSSGGTYSLGNNGSGTLSSGDYKYTNLSLSNNATLTINGTVRLYITGATSLTTGNNVNIVVSNGASLSIYTAGVFTVANNVTLNTVSHLPSQFQVYSTYTGANGVNINNNGTTYAAIYAPQTNITMSNNVGLYGAVVGKTVNLSNNGQVHYDEALATIANPYEDAILTNWQEI